MSMLTDSINWLWNNPVTREIARYPKFVGDLVFQQQPAVVTKVVEKIPHGMIVVPSWTRVFVRLAGVSGAAAVAMGAYGAHVFYQRGTAEELKQVYETANRYHFLHTLALLGVPLCKRPKLAGSLLVLGTAVFSGTCYYYALTGSRTVRQYTPYGGMMLIAGWIAMVL